jgi:hypothetical protein
MSQAVVVKAALGLGVESVKQTPGMPRGHQAYMEGLCDSPLVEVDVE